MGYIALQCLNFNDRLQCLLRASVGLLNLELPTPVRILEPRLYFLRDAVQLQVILKSSHAMVNWILLCILKAILVFCHNILQIVTSLRVSPKFLLLYNHPEAKVPLFNLAPLADRFINYREFQS